MGDHETREIKVREVLTEVITPDGEGTVREGNYSASRPFDFNKLPQAIQQASSQQTQVSVPQQVAVVPSPASPPTGLPVPADPNNNP